MSDNSRLLIGVLALQGAFAAHETMLHRLGARTRRVRTCEDLVDLDGLIIPGGESTTMSNLLVSSGMRASLETAIGDGLPVFGTCAGMILLASHIRDGRDDQINLNAIDIDVRRNAYGRQVDSFETSLEVDGIDHPVPAVFIRAPAIEAHGEMVEVLARASDRPCLVRQGSVMASSFHPELTQDTSIHSIFLDVVHSVIDSTPSRSTRRSTVGASPIQE
ncbi:MAG: pyridoxal 5'-phosphate synthase glutaminase subunit PdxT [Actinomycetota bacterium]